MPLLLSSSALAQPLLVERTAIDFGVVGLHSKHAETLKITNTSDHAVRLGPTDSDCVCLDSSVTDRTLAAGQSAVWTVVLATCDYVGEVRRNVWMETDQPGQPMLQLPVRYHVAPALYAEPSFVPLGLIGDVTAQAQVEIHTTEGREVLIRSAHSDSPLVDVEIAGDVISPASPGSVRIFVHAMPAERFRASIWVETDSPQVPRLRIPIFGESVRGLTCERQEVNFGAVRQDDPATQMIEFHMTPRVAVGGIRASNDSVSIRDVQRSEDVIRVTLAPGRRLPLGTFDGFLIMEVNSDGKARKLKLPYRGRITPDTPPERAVAHAATCCTESDSP